MGDGEEVMAGIGFGLKKLFSNKSYISNIKAYFISAIVIVGPTISCILMITMMQGLLSFLGESYRNRELFTATIIYSFAFSLIITGGFVLFASRYVSDCIYKKSCDKIIPSFFGIIAIILCIVFFTGVLFFAGSNIPSTVKILSYIIFAELAVIWIQSVYLSVIKDYLYITATFIIGALTNFTCIFLLTKGFGFYPLNSVLFSASLGFLLMLLLLTHKLSNTFGEGDFLLRDCFEFLKKIDNYYELFAVGFFYYLGIYGHNFIFWLSPQGGAVEGTYRFSHTYDVPVFYALLTIIPAMVMFVTKVETSFYKKYKEYYQMVTGKGSIKDVKRAKFEMVATLSEQLRYVMEVQFFITFASIVIGMRLLPEIGLTMLSVDIYCILCLGSLAYILMYLIIIILLYFDDRKGAMAISFIFFVSSILFTLITLKLGESFYGYGFFFAALLALVISLLRLDTYLKDIEYYTFAVIPLFKKERRGLFSKLYYRIVRLEGIKNDKKN